MFCFLAALSGCSGEPPEVGQSSESAYGAATAQATTPGGSPNTDVQSLHQNRQNDAQVLDDANSALRALGR